MLDTNFIIYRKISLYLGALTLFIGTVVIFGWISNIPMLTNLNPAWVTMKVNTALGFVLLGAGILFLLANQSSTQDDNKYFWMTRICALILLFMGIATIAEYISDIDLHVDELLWKQKPTALDTAAPGRMSQFTAVMQINFGIALWLLTNKTKKVAFITLAQCSAFLGGIIGILALIGYLMSARELYAVGHSTAIAAHTAICFIMAALGILFLHPEIGLMRTFTSQTQTGQILRRFVPLALLMPIIIGWFNLQGELRKIYGLETELALMVTFCIVSWEISIFWITRKFQEIELVLSQREEQLRGQADLLNLTHDAVLVRDLDGKIVFWNKGAEKIYGYSQLEALGSVVHDLLHTKFPIKLQNIESIVDEEGKWEGELIHRTKSDNSIVMASRWSPKRDEAGRLQAFLEINNDISKVKEAEQQVSEFYSTVSHELRTPLTSMKGVFSLLDGGRVGDLSARAKHLVGMGLQETERLIRLINDILDIKKIEAGKFELNLEDVEPKQLIEQTVEVVTGFALQYKVQLVVEVKDNDLITGDKDRLTQVLTNLISNAVKFSDTDQAVTISSLRRDKFIRFSVQDTGPGINPKNVSKLFRMFQQADLSSRNKEGTGLGLAICKSLVEQHGGTIGVDTELGQGTTFWFEIPCI